MPCAPWLERSELEKCFHEFSGEFSVAGDAIEWLLSPSSNHDRPKLMNLIAQAMLWFHDGCREITDLKAIVSFASCMDILASGGGRKSIRKLICARLETEENVKIHRYGLSVSEIIDQIYDEGRTRFIHGPMRNGDHVWGDKLLHDWSGTRGLAESLARMCLLSCMDWVNNNPAIDEPKQLLE